MNSSKILTVVLVLTAVTAIHSQSLLVRMACSSAKAGYTLFGCGSCPNVACMIDQFVILLCRNMEPNSLIEAGHSETPVKFQPPESQPKEGKKLLLLSELILRRKNNN